MQFHFPILSTLQRPSCTIDSRRNDPSVFSQSPSQPEYTQCSQPSQVEPFAATSSSQNMQPPDTVWPASQASGCSSSNTSTGLFSSSCSSTFSSQPQPPTKTSLATYLSRKNEQNNYASVASSMSPFKPPSLSLTANSRDSQQFPTHHLAPSSYPSSSCSHGSASSGPSMQSRGCTFHSQPDQAQTARVGSGYTRTSSLMTGWQGARNANNAVEAFSKSQQFHNTLEENTAAIRNLAEISTSAFGSLSEMIKELLKIEGEKSQQYGHLPEALLKNTQTIEQSLHQLIEEYRDRAIRDARNMGIEATNTLGLSTVIHMLQEKMTHMLDLLKDVKDSTAVAIQEQTPRFSSVVREQTDLLVKAFSEELNQNYLKHEKVDKYCERSRICHPESPKELVCRDGEKKADDSGGLRKTTCFGGSPEVGNRPNGQVLDCQRDPSVGNSSSQERLLGRSDEPGVNVSFTKIQRGDSTSSVQSGVQGDFILGMEGAQGDTVPNTMQSERDCLELDTKSERASPALTTTTQGEQDDSSVSSARHSGGQRGPVLAAAMRGGEWGRNSASGVQDGPVSSARADQGDPVSMARDGRGDFTPGANSEQGAEVVEDGRYVSDAEDIAVGECERSSRSVRRSSASGEEAPDEGLPDCYGVDLLPVEESVFSSSFSLPDDDAVVIRGNAGIGSKRLRVGAVFSRVPKKSIGCAEVKNWLGELEEIDVFGESDSRDSHADSVTSSFGSYTGDSLVAEASEGSVCRVSDFVQFLCGGQRQSGAKGVVEAAPPSSPCAHAREGRRASGRSWVDKRRSSSRGREVDGLNLDDFDAMFGFRSQDVELVEEGLKKDECRREEPTDKKLKKREQPRGSGGTRRRSAKAGGVR